MKSFRIICLFISPKKDELFLDFQYGFRFFLSSEHLLTADRMTRRFDTLDALKLSLCVNQRFLVWFSRLVVMTTLTL